MRRLLVPPSTAADAVTAIYGWHVGHGTGTGTGMLEVDPPDEAEMGRRRDDVLAKGRDLGLDHVGTTRAVGWKFDRWLDVVFMQRNLGFGASTVPA